MEIVPLEAAGADSPVRIRIETAAPLDLLAELQAGRTGSVAQNAAAEAIDRLRDRFVAMQTRAADPMRVALADDTSDRTRAAHASAAGGLESAMRESLRIQTEVFKLSLGFHAGLSATQQSQNGVKTLVEKA